MWQHYERAWHALQPRGEKLPDILASLWKIIQQLWDGVKMPAWEEDQAPFILIQSLSLGQCQGWTDHF
jgi:hypothetical protein